MPVVIHEFEVEVVDPVTQPTESSATPNQTSVSEAEKQILETLALIEERKQRLQFD